ncbi:hypothetical protein OK074_2602 [Actinobacteria bacterium OK074]|nr:hypothetical protein OK074_2602 [Actinobacteria bacterium OK074]
MADAMADAVPEPLTAESLVDAMLAHRRTAVLRTALELDVFEVLAAGPLTPGEAAERLGLAERAVRVLLGALAAVRLAVRVGGRYALPPGGAELLTRSGARYLGGGVRVAAGYQEWASLSSLTATVRAGGPADGVDACSPGFGYWEEFAAHATFHTRAGAALLTRAVDGWAEQRDPLAPFDVLDIGCGHGLFGLALAERFPAARVFDLDRPGVLAEAERHARRAGLAHRVTFLPGDAFETPLGGPYDLVVLGNLLCQFSLDRAGELIGRARSVLRPGGRLAVVGFMEENAAGRGETGETGTGYEAHMVSLLMLMWTRDGEAHPPSAYRELLAAHGFTDVETFSGAGSPTRILLATR